MPITGSDCKETPQEIRQAVLGLGREVMHLVIMILMHRNEFFQG
jgi:hypothetical protein